MNETTPGVSSSNCSPTSGSDACQRRRAGRAFSNGLVAHEHLWWDQASVLVQLDLLPADGLPVHGADIAERLRSLAGLTAPDHAAGPTAAIVG